MTTVTHTKPADCTVDPASHCCTGCGVDHTSPCVLCSQYGFHADTCPYAGRAMSLTASQMADRVATAMKVAHNLTAERVDYDTAEGYFLDHVTTGASPAQVDKLMSAYGK